MKRSNLGVLAVILAFGIGSGVRLFAAQQPQQQPQPPAQQQTPQASGQPSPPQDAQQPPAAVSSSQQPQAQEDSQAGNSDETKTPKGVKPGSANDVNAIGNRNVGKGLNIYSLEHDIAIGKMNAQEVERTAKLINDPVVTEYVNRVGQNLVRNSDAKVPFTIKVIDTDAINAMALPGGFFYVNSGLILKADEEAELAGVMAHEIAHVAARHGSKTETKMSMIEFATIPLILLGPGGWAGYGLYQGMNLAVPLSYLKFSRDQEREADYLGLQYMYKAGYDPNAFVAFFEKLESLEKSSPGTIPKVFSTHPLTPDRVQKAQEEIATILPARDEYVVTTSEFDLIKARLRRIENRNKLDQKKADGEKPTLRTRTEQTQDKTDKQPTDNGDDSDPDRPVLKKRTDDGQ
jgi:predicted Zn-dependent protease